MKTKDKTSDSNMNVGDEVKVMKHQDIKRR